MIGGAFLRDTMKELASMTKTAKFKKASTPYIYEMYNIDGYFADFRTRGPLTIINPLIDVLNDNQHLPKYILVIPDQDLITNTKYFHSVFVMGAVLHYIVKQLDLYLERRHQDLKSTRPGALSPEMTKTIWV